MTKNVVVIGASYAGAHAAEVLTKSLPQSHRVVLIDRQSHFNHLYIFPRIGVVPNHAHKAFIPYTNLFDVVQEPTPSATPPPPQSPPTTKTIEHIPETRREHVIVHAEVTRIGQGFLEVDRDLKDGLGENAEDDDDDGLDGLADEVQLKASLGRKEKSRIPFEYLIFATGCRLPPPLLSPARNKVDGINFLKAQQALIRRSRRILIVGGGALGIQYATDIADYYNNPSNRHLHKEEEDSLSDHHHEQEECGKKEITVIHSRERFLPIYNEKVDEEVRRRMDVLGVKYYLGQRVPLPSDEELLEQEKTGKVMSVTTKEGDVVEFDLLLRCTGQKPNSALLAEFLPQSVNEHGFVNVLSTMQVALPPSDAAREDIYAIGDVADAGVIKAGHTGWNQAGPATDNIVRSILAKADGGGKEPDLVHYEKSLPQIKVTLGLKDSVSELCPEMGAKTTDVKVSDEGQIDGHWKVIWQSFKAETSDPFR
ncbi:FAD/NAD(P)-binding domain-containing protein [Meredithblackwellia eburnea MCA 4105]